MRKRQDKLPGSAGFTLVELLVVIAIIMLLAGIIMPALNEVKQSAKAKRTLVRITELSNGCEDYKADTGLYPGQRWPGEVDTYTGAQVLGACLFDYNYSQITGNPSPSPKYATVTPGDLITYNGVANVIDDEFDSDSQMPLLYYASTLGVEGLGQYDPNDNAAITGSVTWDNDEGTGAFEDYIKDRSIQGDASTTPINDGRFIIIGAGVDRTYGTNDDMLNP